MADLKRIGASLALVKQAAAAPAASSAATAPRPRVNEAAGRRVVAHTLAPNAGIKAPAPLGGLARQAEAVGAGDAAATADPAAEVAAAAPREGDHGFLHIGVVKKALEKGHKKGAKSGGALGTAPGAEAGDAARRKSGGKKRKKTGPGAGDFM